MSHHAHIKFHYEKKRRSLTCCAFDFRGDRLNQNPTMKYSPCETISECNIARTRLDAFTCESSQSPRAVCQGRRMKHHCRRYVLPETDDAGIIECSLGDNAQEYFQYSKIGDIVGKHIIRLYTEQWHDVKATSHWRSQRWFNYIGLYYYSHKLQCRPRGQASPWNSNRVTQYTRHQEIHMPGKFILLLWGDKMGYWRSLKAPEVFGRW